MFHVKHSSRPYPVPEARSNYIGVTSRFAQSARTTTRRAWLDAFALAVHPADRGDGVMNDLPLKRRHRCEFFTLAAFEYALGHLVPQRGQLLAAPATPARDVEHQPATHSGLLMHRQPGQLLQRVEHLALAADQLVQVVAAVDADDRAAAFDVQVDVAVEVQEVEQLLQVVAGDFAFGDEPLFLVARPRRRRPRPEPAPSSSPSNSSWVGASCTSCPLVTASVSVISCLLPFPCPGPRPVKSGVRLDHRTRCFSARASSAWPPAAVARLAVIGPPASRPAGAVAIAARLARGSLRLRAGRRRVGGPPFDRLALLFFFFPFDHPEHVVLLAEGPDVVREPVEDDRQGQERSTDDHPEREDVQRQLVHHRGLRIGRRLRRSAGPPRPGC